MAAANFFSELIKKHQRFALSMAVGVLLVASLSSCAGEGAKLTTGANQNAPASAKMPQTSLPMPPVSPRLLSPGGGDSPAAAGENSAASVFTRLDERQMKLADYRGQVVVLDFYATWCPPCREEVPHLVELQKRFGPEGLNIIGLNVGGPEDRAQIADFVREYKIQYELGFPAEEMSDLYFSDNTTIPQTYVFDRRGRLVKRFIGYDGDMPAQLESVVRQALDAPAD
ncbi:MAG TPA: TlpA disulfide reductase family protein [Pyrinomonadaceae bacterium]|jgi:thiol-disulfide isomerase/thioredoxin|nr:TlpA disulfide reductase family protein [Pyrinomonadaceae bacterium]